MILSVVNQKGGVGKTTTVINLGAYLGAMDKKVLIIDLDTQGNATTGLGVKKRELKLSSYDVITGKAAVSEAVIETEFKNMSLVPSSNALAGAEMEIFSLENRMSRLRAYIREVKEDYDYILIDCPPALGLLTLNALAASDKLIVPMVAEFYALEGLSQFINTFRAIKKGFNPDLDILGILFVMYDNRMNLSKQVVEEVEKYFPNKIFAARIPRNIRLAEAPSYGRPVLYYDRRSSGAVKYMELAQEITGEKFPQVVKAKLKKVTSTEGASKE